MFFRFIKPITFVVIAVGLFFSYTEPMFVEIRDVQDEINEYQEAASKAAQYNRLIDSLVARKNSFTKAELERLEALAPNSIDEVSVMADLQVMINRNGMVLESIEATEWEEASDADGFGFAAEAEADFFNDGIERDPSAVTVPQSDNVLAGQYVFKEFTIVTVGTYEQFKLLLKDIERSLLLMKVTAADFTVTEGSVGTYSLTIEIGKVKQN